MQLRHRLVDLFSLIWREERVPQDFKDASIIHLYKRKGDHACCDNHRGISLLSVAGKVLARVLLNRLTQHVDELGILPESQCGFRTGRGTTDMIFSARQLQEKCQEQYKDLYLIFIDLTKAFDTVNRPGLWAVLSKVGCPDKFLKIVQSFHDGMLASVLDGGSASSMFSVTCGTKQGCVLAPLLFSIFFAMLLYVAFHDCTVGIPLTFRTDRNLFNLRKLQSQTKTTFAIIRELLFADDCALAAHTLDEAQTLLDRFVAASRRLGLCVSLKKTEALFQPSPDGTYIPPLVTIDNTPLPVADTFCYLGSRIQRTGSLDEEITARLAQASSAFGRLRKRLWDDHGIRTDTKVAVYRTVVLTSLLYSSESWTLYRRHIKKLDGFHMRCLRRILNMKWQDKVPNTTILEKCGISGVEAILLRNQLRWCGHVHRMSNTRIPKQLLYGQLPGAKRHAGGQRKRYKDQLRVNFKSCNIDHTKWETLAEDRSTWREECYNAINGFEEQRIITAKARRAARKDRSHSDSSTSAIFTCLTCGRTCSSRIGLFSHQRSHR